MSGRYAVQVAKPALKEAEAYADFILSQSNDHFASDAWWNGLLDALHSLETMPARCPQIPEQANFDRPLRQLLYASHRIIFTIDGKTVRVFRIYPSQARPLRSLRQKPKAE